LCNTHEQKNTHIWVPDGAKIIKMNTKATLMRRPKMHAFARSAASCLAFELPGRTSNDNATLLPALAHEVRNPLSTINLAVEMLNLGTLDEEQRQFLEIIARGSRRITELINRLLVSSQADEARSELYPLHQLLDDVLLMARDRIQLKHITVRKKYSQTGQSVWIDKEKMKIALSNIITNAIDAMPSEGGELSLIMISAGRQNIIEIRDNGIGISKEHLKDIFKPFFTNKADGLGLGLSVTLDILRANNASVEVRSEEGSGTCFILSLTGPPASIAAYSSAI
jgi:signal transduction histidine kinase